MAYGAWFEADGKEIQRVLRELWRHMLERFFSGLVVTIEVEGGGLAPGLLPKGGDVEGTRALAPYMALNAARVLQALTKVTPPSEPIGAVLRPCEARATVELMKLNQVSREGLFVISIDCLGTYPLQVYKERLKEGVAEEKLPEEGLLREACKVCLWPLSPWADIRVGYIGLRDGVFLEALTERGEEVLKALGLKPDRVELPERLKELDELLQRRREAEEEFFRRQREELWGHQALLKSLTWCMKCHNCMTVCPICYCRECFFNSPSLEFEADRFLELSKRRPALRLPTEVLLFHLTRMAHMSTSCVACGMCQEACPQGVKVFELFKVVSKRTQALFEYEPGRDPEEPLPLTVFKEEELKEVEEPKI